MEKTGFCVIATCHLIYKKIYKVYYFYKNNESLVALLYI